MKKFNRIGRFILTALLGLSIAGCAGMSNTQQRMLSGGAIGAGSGAAIGAISGGSAGTGAAIGGAAGVVGGALVDQHEKSRGRP
jgi:osmotically inducible lipoprotein OsmB